MHHSTDLLTARDVAHLVVHGTSSSTSYETILPVRLESSGDVLSTVDMVVLGWLVGVEFNAPLDTV